MTGACPRCGAVAPAGVDGCPICDGSRVAVAPVPPAWPPPAARFALAPWETQPLQPPTWVQAQHQAAAEQARELDGSATPTVGWLLAGGAIAASGAFSLVSRAVEPDLHRTVQSYLRIAVALTCLVYAVVAAAAWTVVRREHLRLRWTRGAPLPGAALGGLIGGSFGALLLAQTSLVTGHVVIDPSISVQLSEDTWWATVVGMLLLVVVAPVVEEIVFRGVLAQSLLAQGTRVAVLASAPAFWLWHWRLSAAAFVLLAGFGAVLALVYRYRGLVASMAAHATYNGILVAVVVGQLSGPANTWSTGGLTLQAPRSWHERAVSDGLFLSGPSGAGVEVVTRQLDHEPQRDELTQRLQAVADSVDSRGLTAGAVTPVDLPFASGVQVVATAGAHHLTITEVAAGDLLCVLEVDDEGSATAARQAAAILASIRTS